MKKITFLVLSLLMTTLTFGQSALITGYVDSPCSQAKGRVLEIYVDGTVDFTDWTLERQSNGNGFTASLDISGLGTMTDEFAYLSNGAGILNDEFGITADIEDDFINSNGDDAFQILDGSGAVIDRFGEENVDGSGTAWEHEDSYYYRNDGETANGGSFDAVNWTFGALNVFDGQGNCNGGAPLTDFITLGSFSTAPSTEPALTITAPNPNQNFAPGTTSVTVSFTISNFSVSSDASSNDGDGYIQYSTDEGATYTDRFDTDDITLSSLTPGDYSVDMRLVDNNGDELNPAINDAVSFTITEANEVSDIAALRASTEGENYTLTGEAMITYMQSFRNQKYIEDASGAILIDDDSGNITSSYAIGDGMTGLTGMLTSFNGLMQFVPIADPGTASSTGNDLTPQVVTISELNANPQDFESEFVLINDLSFDNSENSTWEVGTTYGASTSDGDYAIYTNFYDADYIEEDVPTTAMNTAGIITRKDTSGDGTAEFFFTPRSLSDFDFQMSVDQSTQLQFTLYPNPVSGQSFTIETAQQGKTQIAIYNMLGKQVLSQDLTGKTVDVSGLGSGMYLVKIVQNGQSTTKKLVVK